MKEYIEREAVLKCVEEDGRDGEYDLGFWRDNKGFQELIKDIPAADVREVKRGKWVDDDGIPVGWDEQNQNCPKFSCHCSVCGEWLTASDEYPCVGNFCPNCGADMRDDSEK